MPTLPTVALHPAKSSGGIVIVIQPHPLGMDSFRSVVGGEKNQGLVINSHALKGIQQTTGQCIEFVNEITTWSALGLAVELRCRQNRRMRNLRAKDREEGFVQVILSVPGDEPERLVVEEKVGIDELVVVTPSNVRHCPSATCHPDWEGWLRLHPPLGQRRPPCYTGAKEGQPTHLPR